MSCLMASLVMLFLGVTPAMALTSLSAARMSATLGVMDGIVRYLCLKNTVLHMLLLRVSEM